MTRQEIYLSAYIPLIFQVWLINFISFQSLIRSHPKLSILDTVQYFALNLLALALAPAPISSLAILTHFTMASQILLKTASGIFLIGAIGHTIFGINDIFGEVSPIKKRDTRAMVKNVWMQLSGYLVLNSTLRVPLHPIPSQSISSNHITSHSAGFICHIYIHPHCSLYVSTNQIYPTGLLSWKWAQYGLETSIDKTIFGLIVGITTTAGLSYARQGIYLPPLLLISPSVALVLSQVV